MKIKLPSFKSQSFKTKDLHPIAYYDSGEMHLPAIILVHGFPFTHQMWDEQIEFLKGAYRTITYDVRGFGESVSDDHFFTMETLSNDFLELMDHLELKTTIALGLSMGGYIVLRAHEKAPERFSGLVLADTQATADSDDTKIKRSATLLAIKEKGLEVFADTFLKNVLAKHESMEKVQPLYKIITGTKKAGIMGALLALISRTDTSKSLRKITVPTLILVGEKDFITTTDASLKMHEHIPLSEMKIIEQAGHLSNIDCPEEFNLALAAFLLKVTKK